jgi:hypothetical protein
VSARESLVNETRDSLKRTLRLGTEELASILQLIQSQLEDGIRSLFTTS